MKKTETKVNLEKDDLKRNGLKREDLEKKNKTEGNAGRGIYRYGMLALFMFCFGLGWFVYAHRESGKGGCGQNVGPNPLVYSPSRYT